MKRRSKYICVAILGFTAIVFHLLPQHSHARQSATRYNPCSCYTYFSDGTIEETTSCDSPAQNGACSKLVMCLPKNKEDH